MSNTKYFTIYWLSDGRKEHISGKDVIDAFKKAGIGPGAFQVIDFYMDGLDFTRVWNTIEKRWVIADAPEKVNLFEMVVMGLKFEKFHLYHMARTIMEMGIDFDVDLLSDAQTFDVKVSDLEKIWNLKFD